MEGNEAFTEEFLDKGSDGKESEVDDVGVGGKGECVDVSVLLVTFGLFAGVRDSLGEVLNEGLNDADLPVL